MVHAIPDDLPIILLVRISFRTDAQDNGLSREPQCMLHTRKLGIDHEAVHKPHCHGAAFTSAFGISTSSRPLKKAAVSLLPKVKWI